MSKTKKGSFSPSVNIERDADKVFEYVVTPNSFEIYKEIVSSFSTGIHSFSIIGSYGTGKSSFLVAFMRNLRKEQHIFEPLNGELNHAKSFEFDLLVGKHESLVVDIAVKLGLSTEASDKEVLNAIDIKHNEYKKEGKYWFLVLDEFGKYLEYAAKNNPEKELYFIQQLSEFANDVDKNLFIINTLHQSFDSYAFGLDVQQRKEWDKVKGRLKELTFNEPVEQLLFIASEHLKNSSKKIDSKRIKKLVSVISKAQVFPLKNRLDEQLTESLYPLDPIAASTLALALQTYGQNERSLFSFLNSDHERGINHFKKETDSFYSLTQVYDYLIYNHHSYLTSKYNPHYIQWNALKSAIERVEALSIKKINEHVELVKVIGLLNIFAAEGAKLDHEFLCGYLSGTTENDAPTELIDTLEKYHIIRFRRFKNQYILFEGTDYDIEFELQNASQKVEKVKDVIPFIKEHISLPYIPAKESFYKKGTPRFFEFLISETPNTDPILQPRDGVINLVFGKSVKEVLEASTSHKEPIFYGVFQDNEKLILQIFEVHKIDFLLKNIENDKVAEKELKALRNSHIDKLDSYILDSIYSSDEELKWVFNGSLIDIKGQRSFNSQLSKIIEEVYSDTPIYKNELINKNKVSPAIYRPRKDLLRRLLDNRHLEDLGFSKDQFPPDKTIYLSLLQNTGLHREEYGIWDFYPPVEGSDLFSLWKICENFFEDSKSGKKDLAQLISDLQKPPVGLKMGFLELWIPLFVIMKSNDCALYYDGAYVPELNYDILNIVFRNPKLFEIKAFNIDPKKKELFNKYRTFQNLPSEATFSNQVFVETIRPFLLTYNDLNEYGRKTNKISPEARKLRDAIKTATDPEKAFFESFPQALGYPSLEELKSKEAVSDFIELLDTKISEIEGSFDQLLNRLEASLLTCLEIDTNTNFSEYISIIQNKFKGIKSYRLADYQKKLLSRLLSKLDDRVKWLSAVGLAIIDKPISKMKDEDENSLFYKLETRIHELEGLVELGKDKVDTDKEEAYKFELITMGRKPIKESFKISKQSLVGDDEKLEHIRKQLTGNKKKDLALLFKLIEDISKK